MAGQGLTKRSAWKTTPPQYNPRVEGLLEQNDPQPKGAGKTQRKLNVPPLWLGSRLENN